jgi:hypothetical protein
MPRRYPSIASSVNYLTDALGVWVTGESSPVNGATG